MQDPYKHVVVNLDAQTLTLYQGDRALAVYPVSSGKERGG